MSSCVFDTVVFVRALLNPLSRWGRLVFDWAGGYHLFVSTAILRETLGVLERPAVARKYRFVAGLDKEAVLKILANAEFIEPDTIPPVSRDLKDDIFLAVAAAAHADYLVSEDNDLLVLGEHAGVRIVDAATFLAILEDVRRET